ncbi:MAG TPA: alpha/beta hydrolase [Burkholderiales bacterium]|nr:alpha/beta hydrolase [Burkholderiales bacterium]
MPRAQQPQKVFVEADSHRLEVERLDGDTRRPTLVFLHEGLGSISMWRDFPARVATATGCPAVVYSRYGYGQSDLLEAPFAVDYMHREALETLPELLARLGLERPVLVGHSDGASIALIHAGSRDGLTGLVALAPHVFVEDISVRSIAEAKTAFETTDLPQKLARHHADARRTFYGWNDIWLHPDFRRWNIEAFLPAIRCPVLAIQGTDDEYGTMAQVEAIERQVAGRCEVVRLAACGHSPHRDQPELTLAAIERFVATL